jgi:hypothetical protein
MKNRFRRPSPAIIIACLALFVSLTGTGIAANHYLITSTKQIKPSVLKHLRGAKGHKGSRGLAGATGATGATGVTGPSGATTVVKRYAVGTASAGFSTATASCNAGETVTGGGADYDAFSGAALPVVRWNAPSPYGKNATIPTGWTAVIDNRGPSGTVTALAWVMCAQP